MEFFHQTRAKASRSRASEPLRVSSHRQQKTTIHPLLQLQRRISNRRMQRWIQAKLAVGRPGDRYEVEADRNAAQITATDAVMRRKCTSDGTTTWRACQPHDAGLVQRTAGAGAADLGVPDSFLESLGSGQSLDFHSRAAMESHFGEDFNDVRLHTDGRAAEFAQAVDALAFTHGHHIVFGAEQYSPDTREGKQLLAHELTHVLQQRGQPSGLQRKPLTPEEKALNLESEKYGSCPRLQLAFDNNPPVRFGERGQAVRLIQEGLVAAGNPMPQSTKPTGELDGIFGEETLAVVRQFQQDSNEDVTLAPHGEPDGLVGRITLGNLERMLVMGFRLNPCPEPGTPPKATAEPCEGPDGCQGVAPPPKGETTKCQPGAFISSGEFLNGKPSHIHIFPAGPSLEITFRNFDTSPASIAIADKLNRRNFALTVRPNAGLFFTTNSTTAVCSGNTGVLWDLEIDNPSANASLVQFVIRSNWRPGVAPCCE
jgi:hypothetical protein